MKYNLKEWSNSIFLWFFIEYLWIWFMIILLLFAEKWVWKPSHVKWWKNTSRLRSISRWWHQLKIVKIAKWIDLITILYHLSWFYFSFLFFSFVHSWLSGHKNYEQCQLLVIKDISSVIVDMNDSIWLNKWTPNESQAIK